MSEGVVTVPLGDDKTTAKCPRCGTQIKLKGPIAAKNDPGPPTHETGRCPECHLPYSLNWDMDGEIDTEPAQQPPSWWRRLPLGRVHPVLAFIAGLAIGVYLTKPGTAAIAALLIASLALAVGELRHYGWI